MIPCAKTLWAGAVAACAALAAVWFLLLRPGRLVFEDQPLPEQAMASMLRALDAEFDKCNGPCSVDSFVWDDDRQADLLRSRLGALFEGTPLTRRSTMLGPVHSMRNRSIALVRREFALKGGGDATATDHVWIIAGNRGGQAVPTGLLETDGSRADPRAPYSCPPCDFEVGGAPGWLCAPSRPDRAESLEAVTFLLVGTDVYCDVSIDAGEEPLPAARVATSLVRDLCGVLAGTRAGAVEPWIPRGPRVPPGVTGARTILDLPDGSREILHVVAIGALRHSIAFRGARESLEAHEGSVQEMLQSYRILDPDVDAGTAAARAVKHHQGGELQGVRYSNRRYRVEFTGPAGWKARILASSAAFSASWTAPNDESWMRMTGHRPPVGLSSWVQGDADRWIEDICRHSNLAVAPGASCEWCSGACAMATRQMELLPCGGRVEETGGPETGNRRILKLAMRPDLLIVLEGISNDDEQRARIRAAFESLKTM
ncbi:MAG: hypothetical protein Fur0037_16320 [Planctomycetota bacterium]